MQTRKGSKNFNVEDQAWNSIAELSLGKAICDKEIAVERTFGTLLHTLRELGLPPECLKGVEGTITDTARGAPRPFDREWPAFPVRICLFCSRKTMGSAHQSGGQIGGGWGYFVIERSRDLLNAPYQELHRIIELYLYKEDC